MLDVYFHLYYNKIYIRCNNFYYFFTEVITIKSGINIYIQNHCNVIFKHMYKITNVAHDSIMFDI